MTDAELQHLLRIIYLTFFSSFDYLQQVVALVATGLGEISNNPDPVREGNVGG